MSVRGPLRDLFNRVLYLKRDDRSPAICMYHAVSTAATREWGPWQYALTPSEFEQQLRWLSHHRTLVSLDALVAYIRGGASLPKDAVVLTFDDGYRDLVDEALPVLREYDAPVTLYVSTALMDERATPYEFRLAWTLQRSEELTVQIGGRERRYRSTTTAETRAAYAELRSLVEGLSAERRQSFLRRNEIADCPEFQIVSPDTVRELADDDLVTVGSHAHIHRRLATVSDGELERDVRRSRTLLADLLGDPPTHFSFPYGSHSQAARKTVREAGFESAVTTDNRLIAPRDWHRCYTLPRVDMAATDGAVPDAVR